MPLKYSLKKIKPARAVRTGFVAYPNPELGNLALERETGHAEEKEES